MLEAYHLFFCMESQVRSWNWKQIHQIETHQYQYNHHASAFASFGPEKENSTFPA